MPFKNIILSFFVAQIFLSFYGCKAVETAATITTTEISKTIRFQPTFGNETLILNKKYPIDKTDSVEINLLRFYISTIAFYNNNQLVHKVENSYHLIDMLEPSTLDILLKGVDNQRFNKVKFNLGIDSLTNVSGAFGGDLDPTKGMYWTWQSGYINLKLEGKSNLCPTRNQRFQYHLGGYQAPFYPLQTVELPIQSKSKMVIYLDIQPFVKEVDLANEYSIMSSSEEAVRLSKIAAKGFRNDEK